MPTNPNTKDIISALAFLIKNKVRFTGLSRLGLPCLLGGTGMAFPWSVFEKTSLTNGNIVEDIQLVIDLALVGSSPILCSDAQVIGVLPKQNYTAKIQRTRWKHAHFQTLSTQVPRLVKGAIVQGRFNLFSLALELSIPPLSLLVILWIGSMIQMLIAGFIGIFWLPLIILIIAGVLLRVGILSGWSKFERQNIPALALSAVPSYLL